MGILRRGYRVFDERIFFHCYGSGRISSFIIVIIWYYLFIDYL